MKSKLKLISIALIIIISINGIMPVNSLAVDIDPAIMAAMESGMATINGVSVPVNSMVLDFNNKKIKNFDTFKVELAQLPLLTRVELKGSNLSNRQMEELMLLYPNVKFVWNIRLGGYWTLSTDQVAFSCNKGEGPNLTNADVEVLKYCTDMVALDLGHNRFTDLSFVKYMPDLRVLIISDGIVSDLTPLKYCKNLVYFEGWYNKFSDLSPLQYLVNLKDINVAHCPKCNDVTPLLHLPALERIYMSYCNVSQASINELKKTFPNATIEMVEYYSDRAGWRKHNRYYEMRKMYKKNFISDAFTPDYNSLVYFAKVFDVAYYMDRYPEVVAVVGNSPVDLLYYFLNDGIYQFQVASPNFDVTQYINEHPELVAVYGGDIGAYLRHYLYN